MAAVDLSPLAGAYDHVLLDLDGCLWVGDEAVPGAPAALAGLRAAGRNIAFLTNDPRHAPEEFVRKLWRLGFQAALDEVVTVGATVQFPLARSGRPRTTYVIGSEAMAEHVAAAGMRVVNGTDLASRADLVVVAGHDGCDYAERARRSRRCGGAPSCSAPRATPPFRCPTGRGRGRARSSRRSRREPGGSPT